MSPALRDKLRDEANPSVEQDPSEANPSVEQDPSEATPSVQQDSN
jgi:hypothetical protein